MCGLGAGVLATSAAHYLPHQRVVVVGFDLARVDQLSSERSEARPFGDAALVCENPTVGDVSPSGPEDG